MPVRLRWVLAIAGVLMVLSLAGIFLGPRIAAVWRRFYPDPKRQIAAVTIYSICGHQVQSGKPSPSLAARLAKCQAGAGFDNWLVLEKSAHELRLARKLNRLCPVCGRRRFLGIADGLVAVYAGTPDKRGEVLQVTKIPAAALPEAELDDLRRGIPLKDDNDRLQLLEGLAALTDE